MARVALLCWELGEGLGHVVGLARAARALAARGWSPVFALPPHRPTFGAIPRGSDIRRAPRWSDSAPPDAVRTGSSASLGDILADAGLRYPDQVRRHITAWHLLFAEVMPDLVVADHAPGALLAARGRIASIAVGTGYSVPPPGLKRFPALHDVRPPLDDEAALVEAVNAALARFGAPPVEALPEILNGERDCAATVPPLDPYRHERKGGQAGPLTERPEAAAGERAGTLCYFQPGKDRRRLARLAEALEGAGEDIIVLAPGASAREAQGLGQGGARVDVQGRPLDALLGGAELVVHAGGHGVACAALLAGTPQLVLDYDIEKQLNGHAVAEAGGGRSMAFDATPPAGIREAILAMRGDRDLLASARRAAEALRPFRDADAAATLADLAEELVPD